MCTSRSQPRPRPAFRALARCLMPTWRACRLHGASATRCAARDQGVLLLLARGCRCRSACRSSMSPPPVRAPAAHYCLPTRRPIALAPRPSPGLGSCAGYKVPRCGRRPGRARGQIRGRGAAPPAGNPALPPRVCSPCARCRAPGAGWRRDSRHHQRRRWRRGCGATGHARHPGCCERRRGAARASAGV